MENLYMLENPFYQGSDQASLGANIGDVSKRDLRWET